ncbi:MAG: hypothetical protein ACO295_05155 [Sediminibacterium sp.]
MPNTANAYSPVAIPKNIEYDTATNHTIEDKPNMPACGSLVITIPITK